MVDKMMNSHKIGSFNQGTNPSFPLTLPPVKGISKAMLPALHLHNNQNMFMIRKNKFLLITPMVTHSVTQS